MGNRIQVNGETTFWLTVGRISAVAAHLVCIYQPYLLFITIPMNILTEGIAYQTLARRWWIEFHEGRFSVITRQGEIAYSDNDVVSMSLVKKTVFSNGIPSGWNRKASLWIKNVALPIRMENTFKQNQADPIRDFLSRIEAMLLAKAKSTLGRSLGTQHFVRALRHFWSPRPGNCLRTTFVDSSIALIWRRPAVKCSVSVVHPRHPNLLFLN